MFYSQTGVHVCDCDYGDNCKWYEPDDNGNSFYLQSQYDEEKCLYESSLGILEVDTCSVANTWRYNT
jgi:hypothetical protein